MSQINFFESNPSLLKNIHQLSISFVSTEEFELIEPSETNTVPILTMRYLSILKKKKIKTGSIKAHSSNSLRNFSRLPIRNSCNPKATMGMANKQWLCPHCIEMLPI